MILLSSLLYFARADRKQIAEALEAAHEQGIIHRDLKPANIKLRPDGTVKVLDFGLAKALEPAEALRADIAASPTITSPALTQMGVILGTAAYLSPEQIKGRPADRRSDVWAFGVVLYELLSGRRAFSGDDVSDTLAAVLRQDVNLALLPPATPPAIRHLVSRCLDRDVKHRLRDIGEARIALDDHLRSRRVDPASGVPRAVAPAAVAPRASRRDRHRSDCGGQRGGHMVSHQAAHSGTRADHAIRSGAAGRSSIRPRDAMVGDRAFT